MSPSTWNGFTVKVADWLAPLRVPEIEVVLDAFTNRWVTTKVVEDAPAGTVTVARTVAATLLEEASVTLRPPVGANPLRVTVPVIVAFEPPITELSLSDTLARDGG